MSSEAISTLLLLPLGNRFASFAVVVVLPEPCRPTIISGDGGGGVQIDRDAFRAEHLDQLVVDDLHDHLPRLDRADDGRADGFLAHALDEILHHVERDVGLDQRAADLAQRFADVGLRQRTAAGDLVENAAQAV